MKCRYLLLYISVSVLILLTYIPFLCLTLSLMTKNTKTFPDGQLETLGT